MPYMPRDPMKLESSDEHWQQFINSGLHEAVNLKKPSMNEMMDKVMRNHMIAARKGIVIGLGATGEIAANPQSWKPAADRLVEMGLLIKRSDGGYILNKKHIQPGDAGYPPADVVEAERKVSLWALINHGTGWQLGHSACRSLVGAAVAADAVVEANRKLLLERSRVGIEQYKTTLADSDLSEKQLLRHALEEVLDLANYIQAILMKDEPK